MSGNLSGSINSLPSITLELEKGNLIKSFTEIF